jgi:hypothetical protein
MQFFFAGMPPDPAVWAQTAAVELGNAMRG